MTSIGIFAAVLIGLFAGAFVSRRRFGLLGLALTAGATLSALWGDDAGYVVEATGLVQHSVMSQAIVQGALVLLPAVLLLFHGTTYKHIVSRLIGSVLFALLALAFLADPLGHIVSLQGISATVYEQIVAYKGVIISVGVVLAVVDLLFTKPARLEKGRKHER
ncbi:MAG TPA: hypothetical protein VN081_02015 [Dongiaceae bacterium]|nr:hypothetical protein [Dongiaceae bacterium]